MKNLKGKIVIVLITLFLVGALAGTTTLLANSFQEEVSSQPSSPPDRLAEGVASLADAEAILGTRIPIPSHLPSGYEVRKIFVGGTTNVAILFSDEVFVQPKQTLESSFLWESEFERHGGARLVLDIQKVQTTACPDQWEDIEAGRTDILGEVVDLGQVKGRLVDPMTIKRQPQTWDAPGIAPEEEIDNIWYMEWSHSKYKFTLKAPKKMSRKEVIKIASSVPVLTSSFKEVSAEDVKTSLGLAVSTLDLPDGYEIRRVFAWGDDTVYLLISDIKLSIGVVKTESQLVDVVGKPNEKDGVKMVLRIDTEMAQAAYPGYDLFEVFSSEGELRDFGGGKAIVRNGSGYDDLEWFTQKAHFRLKACADSLSENNLAAIVISGGAEQ